MENTPFDHNYAATWQLFKSENDYDCFPSVKSPELQEIRDNAQSNLVRLVSLMLLPAKAAQLGGHEQAIANAAAAAVSVPHGAIYLSAKQKRAVFDEMNKLREKAKAGEFQFWYQCESSDEAEAVIRWYSGRLGEADKPLRLGMDSLYASSIVMAYSLVETTTDDLWIAAVNARPETLAKNVINRKNNAERQAAKVQEPTIALKELADYGFNISKKMGCFLKNANRVSLDAVIPMMDAYDDAFWNPAHSKSFKKCVALHEIFDNFKDNIIILEKLRNMIVHQGSKIDDVFFQAIRYKEHGLGQIDESDIGKKLLLSGQMVVRYTACALNFSAKLLSFVDDWLVKYPDPNPKR